MQHVLVAYYSLFGNTASFAETIALHTGGALLRIVPDQAYSFDYNTAAKEVRNEIARGFCPTLKSGNESVEAYDTLFIGTPNWFKTVAPPVLSFLRSHSLKNKTVIPFCTNGGGGFGNIEAAIRAECAECTMLPGLAVTGTVTTDTVIAWLKSIGYPPSSSP